MKALLGNHAMHQPLAEMRVHEACTRHTSVCEQSLSSRRKRWVRRIGGGVLVGTR